MKHLRESKPICHVIIWVAIYVALVNVGDLISSQTPSTIPVTGILLGCLSIALLIYLKRANLNGFYGLKRPQRGTMASALYLVSLFAIAFFQYVKGLRPDLDAQTILFACLLVVCVGFIEELLFRGFLFQALKEKGTLNRAILISGVTFGIGHIVNLTRGYSTSDQVIQVIGAVAIGIALAYCVALTGSIVPGLVFHALFNLSGTLTNPVVVWDMYIVGAVIVILIPYILFMRNRLARMQAQISLPLAKGVAAHADVPA